MTFHIFVNYLKYFSGQKSSFDTVEDSQTYEPVISQTLAGI